MRILQIINDLRVAGAETLCTQLTLGLRDEGHDVRVMALRDVVSPLSSAMDRAGASVAAVSEAGRTRPLRSPSNIRAIRRQMTQFDIVHVHLFPAQFWAAIAFGTLPQSKRPLLVTTEHNTYNRRRKVWYRGIDRLTYGTYARIVAISDATAGSLEAWLPEMARRVVVIPNGIDYIRFASASTAARSDFLPANVPGDVRLLLCAGRLSEQKDQATALRALARISNAHLCLAGAGELEGPLKELVERLGIGARVHFLGRRDDLPALLKAVDVYIQPSRWEGFGLAAAEAMAAGAPVVYSDVPGMREVVGDAGLRFPAGDSEGLAEAVNSILDDPNLAAKLSQKGERTAGRFTLERFVADHAALYETLTLEAASLRGSK